MAEQNGQAAQEYPTAYLEHLAAEYGHVTIDRYDWHSGGDFPEELPPENGGTHIGMFLAWIILNCLQGQVHDDESVEALNAVRLKRMTGREFLFTACDGKFWGEDLSDEVKAFTAWYYSGRNGKGYGKYILDYEQILAVGSPTMYHVKDTWENYDLLVPTIALRYTEWKAETLII